VDSKKEAHRPSRPGTGGVANAMADGLERRWGANRGMQTARCKPQTLQTLQTSIRVLTVAGFCGAAPRLSRGAGRTRRPFGARFDLLGRCCGEGVTLQGACRPWGKRYTASGGCVAPKKRGFCDPAYPLTTNYVTLLDAAVSSLMRGGCPLSSTTMIVNACRQRRHAVCRAQPSSWQITFHGT
jgi:hypothetical protein